MKKNGLIVALVCIVAYGAWRWHRSGGDTRTDADIHDSDALLVDRIWIDHLPKNDKDTVNVFIALTQQPVGLFQAASTWRGEYELFGYELRGDELRVIYPQSGDHEKIKARARRCNKGEMDFCLELRGSSHGVKTYYSRKGWEIDGADAREAELRGEILARALAAGQ